MSAPARQAIEVLHAAYARATGFDLPLDMSREMAWFELHRRGITSADLLLVIDWIKRGIRSQTRNPGALKFRNLVGNPDYLEEDLAEAKAAQRRPRVDPARASVLQATGRPAAPEPPQARSAAQVVQRADLGSAFRSLKEKLQ